MRVCACLHKCVPCRLRLRSHFCHTWFYYNELSIYRELLKSASQLPHPPQIGVGDYGIPDTVLDWLNMINLADYESKFTVNRYFTMDRIRAIWEFELTTVRIISIFSYALFCTSYSY